MVKMNAAELIKELREKTGAGILDCKKALGEAGGDLDAAIDWLRKKGLAAAAKKTGRITAEGLVGIVTEGTWGAVLEVNSETDFVARNEKFQQFVSSLLKIVKDARLSSLEALKKAPFGNERTVEEELSLQVATIGESLSLRRLEVLSVSKGVVVSYVHGMIAPQMGKIGVLVVLESEASSEELVELGRQIAMHVAATKPLFLSVSDVDSESLRRERDILSEQAKASGRPQEVVEKMVEGRLRKYFEEVVLEEQIFVIDGKTKILNVVNEKTKLSQSHVQLKGFVRVSLGEGVGKPETDFAAEVNAQIR
ncbi:MAG: translation elongation factor Ts [Holosporales bacterium]|nr:translation elongation factor Ts [Holosporales bacterium]